MFSELDPEGKSTRLDIRKKGTGTFDDLKFIGKRVIYPEHLAVIYRLLKAVDKPLYGNVAESLCCLETLDKNLADYEKDVLDA